MAPNPARQKSNFATTPHKIASCATDQIKTNHVFVEKSELKISSFQKYEHGYLISTRSNNDLKGTVVNRDFFRGATIQRAPLPLEKKKKITILKEFTTQDA